MIRLAFRSLINGRGIWLWWVNAITHAACVVTDVCPLQVQHRPFLSSLSPFPVCSVKRLVVHSQQEQTHGSSALLAAPPEGPAWLLNLAAAVQRSIEVESTSLFSFICCKCAEMKGLCRTSMPLRPHVGFSVALKRKENPPKLEESAFMLQ